DVHHQQRLAGVLRQGLGRAVQGVGLEIEGGRGHARAPCGRGDSGTPAARAGLKWTALAPPRRTDPMKTPLALALAASLASLAPGAAAQDAQAAGQAPADADRPAGDAAYAGPFATESTLPYHAPDFSK